MLTVDEHTANAPAELCFQTAADVERWPELLSHYRWVRFHRKDGFARGKVEMAAWRPFGPLSYPAWWVSEMEHDRDLGIVLYRHVEGITKGMDVRWEVEPLPGNPDRTRLRIVHEWDGPHWPGVGRFAADRIIGPHFVSHIAGRTLAGLTRAAEARARAEGS